jgi:hypothetical protein
VVVHSLMLALFSRTGILSRLAVASIESGMGPMVSCSLRKSVWVAHWRVVAGTLHFIRSYNWSSVHSLSRCRLEGSPIRRRSSCGWMPLQNDPYTSSFSNTPNGAAWKWLCVAVLMSGAGCSGSNAFRVMAWESSFKDTFAMGFASYGLASC